MQVLLTTLRRPLETVLRIPSAFSVLVFAPTTGDCRDPCAISTLHWGNRYRSCVPACRPDLSGLNSDAENSDEPSFPAKLYHHTHAAGWYEAG